MQSESAISSVDVDLGAISGSARAGQLSPEIPMTHGDGPDADERWRQWRARGVKADRDTVRMMNGGFAVLLLTLLSWLVYQAVS